MCEKCASSWPLVMQLVFISVAGGSYERTFECCNTWCNVFDGLEDRSASLRRGVG